MESTRFLLLCLSKAVAVAGRRLVRGPRHARWSYSLEVLTDVLRTAGERGLSLPVARMRRGLAPAPIHPRIRSAIVHERVRLAGLPTEKFVPVGWRDGDPTLLYLHGGGYIVCSPATHRDLVSRIATATGARAFVIDYRKAPEHPFPAAIDDSMAAYRALLGLGVPGERLFVAGDSAGGGLALALLQRARDEGLAMPRGAVLLSPWCDLEATGESVKTNAAYDYLDAAGLHYGARHYMQDGDRRHPHVSAVHADLAGLPPLLIQTGSAELLLSENERLASRAAEAGVDVTHEVEHGMVHVFQAFASLVPECEPAILRIGEFVRGRLGAPEPGAPPVRGGSGGSGLERAAS